LEVIRDLERMLGRSAQIRFQQAHEADLQETWADITKAKRLLQWQPRTELETGLEACVRWYNDHREWAAGIR
jgi:nucleoside-diphosphate-sugar epimerase